MSNLPNPYVGPRAYEVHETLYGRDREIRQLVALLIAERIVLLHSPSGAGKTSLLQAGLIPQMQEEDFHVLPVVRVNLEAPAELTGATANRYLLSTLLSLEEELPEQHRQDIASLPGLSLDAYLNCRYRPEDASPSQLIVFDQFEEVLTLAPSDRDGKLAFFEQLGVALRNRDRWAVFSMREDYVAALSPYLRPIPNRLSATFRLDLLSREAAMQAIQKPSQAAGVEFTTAAAEKLINDLSQVQEQDLAGNIETQTGLYVEPVQLQVVCYRLWDTHVTDDRVITAEDLGQVGSVDDSLAGYYAECVACAAADMKIEERAIREWFGSKLITPEGVRAQVLQRAGTSDGLDNRAIQQMVDAHILRAEKHAGSTWFELSHDRMIAPVLKSNTEWFEANLRLFQMQAGLWDRHGRSEGMLLHSLALAEAEQEASKIALTPVERDFLEASKKAHDRREQDQQRRRMIAILAIVVAAVTIIAIVAGVLGLGFRDTANELATQNAQISTKNVELIGAIQTAQVDKLIATVQNAQISTQNAELVKAIQNAQADKQTATAALAERDQAETLAKAALARQLVTNFTLDAPVTSISVRPDGQMIALGSSSGEIWLCDAATGKEILRMQHNGPVTTIAFSSDGSRIISGSEDKTARVWDPATGKEISRMQHPDVVSSVAFSPDGKWAASGSNDGSARVWEAATGQEILGMVHNEAVFSVAFSPDGRQFVTVLQGVIRVWDVASGEVVARMQHDAPVTAVAISPDGKFLASGSEDKTVRVWAIATGKEIARMQHNDIVTSVAFSPDGKTLVSASYDGTARVWEAATGRKTAVLQHNGAVYAVAFSPDGKRIVSGSEDQTARIWDVISGQEEVGIHQGVPVTRVSFTPDGRRVVSLAGNGQAEVRLFLLEDLTATACSLLTRNLTQTEWLQNYGYSPPSAPVCPNLPSPSGGE